LKFFLEASVLVETMMWVALFHLEKGESGGNKNESGFGPSNGGDSETGKRGPAFPLLLDEDSLTVWVTVTMYINKNYV